MNDSGISDKSNQRKKFGGSLVEKDPKPVVKFENVSKILLVNF